MRKNKVTQLHVPTATPAKAEFQRGTLPWAHDMTGHAMDVTQQLETVARRLSGMPGGDTESGSTDLATIMGLFAENLQQVAELLEDVRTVMEDADPSILKEVNA